MDWNRNGRDSFTISGDLYAQSDGESVQATSYTAPYSFVADANEALTGGNFVARWKRVQGDGNDIQIEAYYDRTNRFEPNFGEIRSVYDIDFLQRIQCRVAAHHLLGAGRAPQSRQGYRGGVRPDIYAFYAHRFPADGVLPG